MMNNRRRGASRTRPGIEWLEARLVLSASLKGATSPVISLGEAYYADGQKIELTRRAAEFAVSVPSGAIDSLVATGSPLAGFEVGKRLTDSTAILRRKEVPAIVGPVRPVPGAMALQAAGFDPIHPEGLPALLPAVAWAAPVYQSGTTGTWMVATDELIVALRPGQAAGAYFAGDARFSGYRPLLGTSDQFVATVAAGPGAPVIDLAADLKEDPRLAWASPNFYQDFQKFAVPNDPLYNLQWHLENNGIAGGTPDADVDIEAAWDLETGRADTVIAVVDDGMEFTHPDLLPNLFINSGEIAGNGIDDDGNGWVDDRNGWDFTTNGSAGDNNPGADSVNDAHATSVAGVAAARGNNGIGVTGASQLARILPVRIFGSTGAATTSANIASAVNYAAGRTANGSGQWADVHVMNNSWGGGSPDAAITAAFTWASNTARSGQGTATFISSGNGFSASVSYPAVLAGTLSGVVAVGASTNFDERSTYSNYGPQLSFVASSNGITYGGTADILTTDRVGANGYNWAGSWAGPDPAGGNYTDSFGGTSSASPLAAGIAGLVLSRAANLEIELTAAQVKGLLSNSTDLIGPAGTVYNAATGFNNQYGTGRLNAGRAVGGVGSAEIGVFDGRTALADGDLVAFGGQLNGSITDRVIRIRNEGTRDLNLTGLALTGNPDFSILAGPADTTLSVGESTSLVVRFQPSSAGPKSAALEINSDDEYDSLVQIDLTGDGLPVSISGLVFEDWDNDGVLDPEDTGLAGRRVYLDLNSNGQLDESSSTVASGAINLPIPDNSAAGVNSVINSAAAGRVTDINVVLNITHTWVGDLIITLRSPAGTTVTLVNQRGGSGDNLTGTILDDEAAAPIAAGAAPFTGRFRPESPLAAFDGQAAAGAWTLNVSDRAGSDLGTLLNWSLEVMASEEPSTTTDGSGFYVFLALPAATYTVGSVAPTGWDATTTRTVVLPTAESESPGQDLAQVRTDAIYAFSYNDQDGDGLRVPGEPGLSSQTIYLDSNSNGQLDNGTTTVASGAINLPIPDNSAAGVNSVINSAAAGAVTDVEVTLNITHTWVADLIITLRSPAGTTVTLVNQRGGSGDNFTGTILDDEAAAPIAAGAAPFTGRFRPESPLAAFDGQAAAGAWTLNVSDRAGSDLGTLLNWSLTLVHGEASATTDSLGRARFDAVAAGEHKVRQVVATGWMLTSPPGGVSQVSLASGGTAFAAAFGNHLDAIAPAVDSIATVGANPTNAASVSWTITFSEPVTGLSLANFELATSGPSGASLTGLSGSGATYTITASTGTGDGTIGLDLAHGTGVVDLAGNPLAGAPTTGPAFTVDKTAPEVVAYRVLYGSGKSYNLIGSPGRVLPWEVTGIQAVLSEPADAATAGSLTGLSATSLTGVGTTTLTWGLAGLSQGIFATGLLGSGAGAILDAAGNPLAGGGGFAQTFRVLLGDFSGDGVVNAADLSGVYNRTVGVYNAFADIDGDGDVDAADVAIVRRRIGTRL